MPYNTLTYIRILRSLSCLKCEQIQDYRQITIVLECFHFVSLFSIRNKLIQENRLRQQYC